MEVHQNINREPEAFDVDRETRKRQLKYRLEERINISATPKKDQFLPIGFMLLDNEAFRNGLILKKRFRTYLWLRRHVVRGGLDYDTVDIYGLFWLSGKLAVSIPLNRLAKDLKLSKSTVSDHIRQLEEDWVLFTDTIDADEATDGNSHKVCVLGTCSGSEESWFIDDVFSSTN